MSFDNIVYIDLAEKVKQRKLTMKKNVDDVNKNGFTLKPMVRMPIKNDTPDQQNDVSANQTIDASSMPPNMAIGANSANSSSTQKKFVRTTAVTGPPSADF